MCEGRGDYRLVLEDGGERSGRGW
ncbi:hypothetical protein BPOR_1579g00020 [Botrytis porri]|uniref:Uncharacterized protein n=1 Tax=Botrytis porri TaxID=87229 RepID=A0A4Z1KBI5_9HELO|nr:hypothetical protein BPOR_1579g00020 [Botrytis porri]